MPRSRSSRPRAAAAGRGGGRRGRGARASAGRGHAARRDARPARRRHGRALAHGRRASRATPRRRSGSPPTASSACTPPACCTTSASSASPTRSCTSRARSTRPSGARCQRHPEIGARILEHAGLRDIAAWVLAHHERLDGARLPERRWRRRDPARGAHPRGRRRLRGDDRRSPLPARHAAEEARAELERCAGTPVRRRRRRGVPGHAGRAPRRGRGSAAAALAHAPDSIARHRRSTSSADVRVWPTRRG